MHSVKGLHWACKLLETTRNATSMIPIVIIIPPATKLGGYTGITMSVCPSVRLSSSFGFPAHNCFPITPIIMKLHMQTPHEARMCPIDFEVQRSRSQCINYWKWFPAHNCFPFTPIIMKLHMQTPHEARMCPIDFEVWKKINLDHNFWTKSDRALILHIFIPCDKTFLLIPIFLT